MRRALISAGVLVCLLLLAAFGAAEVLSRPASRSIGVPPANLQAEVVTLNTTSQLKVAGWFTQGRPGAGAVLLLHGVRGDRRDMLGRALALHEAGYAVMLIDLPAHGESEGDRITFGLREAAGVAAALDFLRIRVPAERIGVIGVSLGAAALIFSRPEPAPAAVVLESMYPTITEAVENRLIMRFGSLGRALAPVLLLQLPLRLGITADELRPINEVASINTPLLFVAGSLDLHTTLPETYRLFAAAQEPKELWVVEGASHVNLHSYNPQAYEQRVFVFLARQLRGGV